MENQHRKITGYRELDQNELDLMNRIKAKANEVGEIIAEMESDTSLDQRWIAEAKTNLQVGFMLAVRSVAQPTTFA